MPALQKGQGINNKSDIIRIYLKEFDYDTAINLFTDIHQPIPQDEVFILFADKPFDNIDKVTTQYIDVFDVAESTNNFTLVYDTGEFFAEKEIVQDTYPPIRAVL